MDSLQKELIQETNDFNRFLAGSFVSPEIMEARLSEIQARVAVLTKGWYGTDDTRCTAREEFNIIMLRFEAITFFIRQMKDALKAKIATKEHYDLIVKAVNDPVLEKKIRTIQDKVPTTEFDPIAKESWDAIVLNLGLKLRRAVYTGIENRLQQEAKEQHEIEKLRAQNPGLAVAAMGQLPGGLPIGITGNKKD